MNIQFPHIKYVPRDPANRHFGFIEVDGMVAHRIENLEEFYEALGFSSEMRKQGVLPDEFIWDEYIRNAGKKYTECYDLHILEYLAKKNAIPFMNKYGTQCESWIAGYAEARCTRCTCNLKPCQSLRYPKADTEKN
jgi:hypothetical protein